MAQINPFRISVPDADLADLKERLARTRWPEAECVDDWSQGIPLATPVSWPTIGQANTTGAHAKPR